MSEPEGFVDDEQRPRLMTVDSNDENDVDDETMSGKNLKYIFKPFKFIEITPVDLIHMSTAVIEFIQLALTFLNIYNVYKIK